MEQHLYAPSNEHRKKVLKLTTSCISIVFFFSFLGGIVLLAFLAPLTTDDWAFFQRTSGASLFTSAAKMYQEWGGGISPFLIQWFGFQNSFTDLLWRLLNGLLVILVIYTGLCCVMKKRLRLWDNSIYIGFFCLWFALPVRGETLFWRVGSAPYLWSLLFSLLPLLPFFYENMQTSCSKSIFSGIGFKASLFLCALIAGLTHLQSSFASFFAVSIFLILQYKKNRITLYWQKIIWIGIAFGFFLFILAPGNYVRLAVFDAATPLRSTFSGKIFTLLFYYCRIFGVNEYSLDFLPFIPMLILFTYYLAIKEQHRSPRFLFFSGKPLDLFLLMSIGSLLILAPLGGTSTRAGTTAIFYFVLWLLGKSTELVDLETFTFPGIKLLIASCLLLNVALGIASSFSINGQLVQREALIQHKIEYGENDITVPSILNLHNSNVFFEDQYPSYAHLFNVNSIKIEPVSHTRFTFASAKKHVGSINSIIDFCLAPIFYRKNNFLY